MGAISRALAFRIAIMISAIVISVTMISPQARAQAQNLDQDKNGPKLFAATCAECHRSARGLAKGRFSVVLWYYLQQHYTSSSATARTLTAYLQSVDTPARSKTGKSPSQPTRSVATSGSALRPPASVPAR
jgi:mono/diheme cytochrome c family protein